ncbi:molybdate transport system permease protein [Paraburkholderia sp. BL6665CI2N2]|uniref:ABC transporter ATP-binding protein/permease n=1 Tax=Paraburkholderia sp. BL6665CI2N2 TaxID=1938806 RepID=UPI001065DE2D|nr:ATP-binding cassette domain-containing protein [Paraburkholderia sp. BL6665CI2N2]TDY21645.1 molybdate transport system permease protein [Paraburkholderia sp. BL6665CI2N2]
MKRTAAHPLLWLAALLAVYLCAPFVASVPQLGAADWANVDWRATWSAVGVSAASASVASLAILLGGVPLGYFLARSNSRKVALLGFVVQLPLALPPLTSGVLLLFLLGPYSWVGRFTNGVLTDSFAGIVLAEVFVAAPFLIIAAKSAFTAVDPILDDVAATLGHHAGSRFFRVMLPVAWPAIRAGLALAWLRAFGEFGATVMVAYHPYSLPVYTYVVFGGQGLPAMMPLLLPTLAIAVVCAALSIYSLRQKTALDETENGDDTLAPGVGLTASNGGETADLRLAFHLRRQLGAFDLDLAWMPATRRLAIIGPSGSGKSLALRLIAGLESNATSRVTLGATPLNTLPPERRQIGYMPQDYGLFPHMTVAQQLAFPVDADPASARYWLDHLGLARLVARLPHQLSFGQRQRVALARALTRHSELLLFDEPFAALDTPRRRRLQQSLRALQREIAAVTIIVTHDPDEAALLADEVLVVEQGRVLQAGAIDAVFERPASMRVAGLLGLHNVGEGVMSASGQVEIAPGFAVGTGDSGLALCAGERVMWRVSSHAIVVGQDGTHVGLVDAVELRRGERYVRVNIAGVRFDIANEDTRLREGAPCRIHIRASGVAVWPASDAAH